MRPVIYYRESLMDKEELAIAKKYFPCTPVLTDIKAGDLVICRYSFLPFARDIVRDIENVGAKTINSLKEHRYIADLMEWYVDIPHLTPRTWTRLDELPDQGPFVLKGQTNSRKFDWSTHMFAMTKRDAISVHSRLLDDSLFREQNIYIRSYVPLKTYLKGIKDLPITKEFRFFVYRGKVISAAYYWSGFEEDLEVPVPSPDEVPASFIDEVLEAVGRKAPFLVIDIAQAEDGRWWVIELNDGCMSGLSANDPEVLYSGLRKAMDAFEETPVPNPPEVAEGWSVWKPGENLPNQLPGIHGACLDDRSDDVYDALDAVYQTVDCMLRRGCFRDVDDLLDRVDVTQISTVLVLAWLSITSSAKDKLARREAYLARAEAILSTRDPNGIGALLDGLR